jgi:hypothetical protein
MVCKHIYMLLVSVLVGLFIVLLGLFIVLVGLFRVHTIYMLLVSESVSRSL